jgi:hypothetical protein
VTAPLGTPCEARRIPVWREHPGVWDEASGRAVEATDQPLTWVGCCEHGFRSGHDFGADLAQEATASACRLHHQRAGFRP